MTPAEPIEGNYSNITELIAVHILELLMIQGRHVFTKSFVMKWVRSVIGKSTGTRKKLKITKTVLPCKLIYHLFYAYYMSGTLLHM